MEIKEGINDNKTEESAITIFKKLNKQEIIEYCNKLLSKGNHKPFSKKLIWSEPGEGRFEFTGNHVPSEYTNIVANWGSRTEIMFVNLNTGGTKVSRFNIGQEKVTVTDLLYRDGKGLELAKLAKKENNDLYIVWNKNHYIPVFPKEISYLDKITSEIATLELAVIPELKLIIFIDFKINYDVIDKLRKKRDELKEQLGRERLEREQKKVEDKQKLIEEDTQKDTNQTYVDEEQKKIEDTFYVARYFDKQKIATTIHKSIKDIREKDIDNTLDMLSVNDIAESISDEDAIRILNKSVGHIKDKNNKEKSDKEKKDNVSKETKKRAEEISIEEYVKMFHGRLRQGLFIYEEIDIKFFFASMLSGQWTSIEGVNGIGKDLLLKLFGTLSCEDADDQILIIPPSPGQEIDDIRTLGYQSPITHEYYPSKPVEHIIKANKNLDKLYIIVNTEANILNMDKAYLPISVAIDSAQKKIILPLFRKEGDKATVINPEITSNILIYNTVNESIRRPGMTVKDVDRVWTIGLWDPIIRSTEDRKKLENADGTNNFKDITGPDPIFIELCKKHILTDKSKFSNLRVLGFIDNEYRSFENDYQDDLRDNVNKLNDILKNGHLRHLQMAPRFTEDALRFLYFSIIILKIDPILAKNQLMLEKFIPRLKDESVIELHIDTLDKVKDILIEYISDKDADTIKEIDEIIWRLDPYHKLDKK